MTEISFVLGIFVGCFIGIVIYAFVDWLDKKLIGWKAQKKMADSLAALGKATAGKTLMGNSQADYIEKIKKDNEILNVHVKRHTRGRKKGQFAKQK